MFAIVSKSDGFPVSRNIGEDKPALIVTWTSDARAQAFIAAKGIDADYRVVALTEATLNSMAEALGCSADAIDFDSYPEQ
jgi:hypothetical protein